MNPAEPPLPVAAEGTLFFEAEAFIAFVTAEAATGRYPWAPKKWGTKLRIFCRFAGDIPLAELRQEVVERLLQQHFDKRKAEVKRACLGDDRRALRQFLEWLNAKHQLWRSHPLRNVKLPSTRRAWNEGIDPKFPNSLHASIIAYVETHIESRFSVRNVDGKTTAGGLTSILRQFCLTTPDVDLATLSQRDAITLIQNHMNRLKAKGLKACSIDNARRALSTVFSTLRKEGKLTFDANPCERRHLTLPREIRRIKAPINDRDLKRLIAAARETDWYPQFVLCLACGLRRIEACRVQPSDIDLEARTLRVLGKNRERIVPLSAWVVRELTDRIIAQIHFDTFAYRFSTLRKNLNLTKSITLQSLRRNFLKKLLDNDVPVQKAAALAGNSLPVIAKHYVDLETLNSRGVVDVLDFSDEEDDDKIKHPTK